MTGIDAIGVGKNDGRLPVPESATNMCRHGVTALGVTLSLECVSN
jgi:hypothetical protein